MKLHELKTNLLDYIRNNRFTRTYVEFDRLKALFVCEDDVRFTFEFEELHTNNYLDEELSKKYEIDKLHKANIIFKFNGQAIFKEGCSVAYCNNWATILPANIEFLTAIEEERDILFESINSKLPCNLGLYDRILDEEKFDLTFEGWEL